MKNLICIVFLTVSLLLASVNVVLAFEVDGFRAGMLRQEVLSELLSRAFKVTPNKDNFDSEKSILASDDDGHFYMFLFEKEKLKGYQKNNLDPSIDDLIDLYHKVAERYGKPDNTGVDIKLTGGGDEKEIYFRWDEIEEMISVTYVIHPPQNYELSNLKTQGNHQLYISYLMRSQKSKTR